MITEIVDTYKSLVNTGERYYEQEIVAKLEDSFIFNFVKVKRTTKGLKIIHGHRSMVTYHSGIGTQSCELGDMEIVMFDSTKPGKYRRVFLQFKEIKKPGDNFKVKTTQDDLYENKLDFWTKSGSVGKTNRMNSMYAIICGNDVSFGNCDAFSKIMPRGPKKVSDKRSSVFTGAPYSTKKTPYVYCEYADNLEEFLAGMKKMEVGEELTGTINISGNSHNYPSSLHLTIILDVSVL